MIGAGRISLIVHCISDASSCVSSSAPVVGQVLCSSLTILRKERWFGELGRIGSKF